MREAGVIPFTYHSSLVTSASPPPLVRDDAVLQLDERGAGRLLLVGTAEEEEDGGVALALLGVAPLPDLRGTLHLRCRIGLAQRGEHPPGGRLAGFDLGKRGVGHVVPRSLLSG